ncbi:MAG: hypothetical protein ACFFAO_21900 [Candidatus Hermodarchaeota archaeon]
MLNSSGLELNVNETLDPFLIKKLAIAYGLWLKNKDKRVILGRDTRPSSQLIEKTVIEGLVSVGIKVFNAGICPLPVLMYVKDKLKLSGGMLISDSHKPVNWNKIKLFSKGSTLNSFEQKEISAISNDINLNNFNIVKYDKSEMVKSIETIPNYIHDIYNQINFERVKNNNNLRVILDTGAGAGKVIASKLFEGIGCEVLEINKELDRISQFPRKLDLRKENLGDLIMALWKGNYDVGFAFDCDMSNLGIIANDFELYSEDTGFALIMDYFLKQEENQRKDFVCYLNLASSLRFEVLAEKHKIKVHKTYITGDYRKEKDKKPNSEDKNAIILGSEGMYGGPTFPQFNKVKDSLFIALKLIEILVDTKEPLSSLFSNLPNFYSYYEKVELSETNLNEVISRVREELVEEGEYVLQYSMSLRFGHGKEWYVLIYPFNNSLQIKSEANRDSLARLYCETTVELINLVISKL